MNTVKDLSYLAGIIDGEGSISVSFKRRENKKKPLYRIMYVNIQITNTNFDLICACKRILDSFRINYSVFSQFQRNYRREQKSICVSKIKDKLHLCELIEPYLVGKKLQCQLAIVYFKRRLKHFHKESSDLDLCLAGLIKSFNFKKGMPFKVA